MKQKTIFSWTIVIVVTLFLLEMALRIQQRFGPIYDLKFEQVSLDGISDVVNHKPLRKNTRKLSNPSMYGGFNGFEYIFYYDSNGIRENRLRSNDESGNNAIRILFMGDSFIQGYDDKNTVPQHVWVYFKKKGIGTNIYNAGFMSYSPAIFIPQSKQIIPKLKPDFVVVDIDETDLGDDFIRYQKLIVRDDYGKNIAVKFSPLFYENYYGFLKIKQQPLFIIRLMQSLYHTKIYMPAYKKHYRNDNRGILDFSRDKSGNAQGKYQKEIDFFRRNVGELAETLIDLMDDRGRILFLYHPHLQHLKSDSDGRSWNCFVSNTIKEVAETYDIAFYDASNDLRIQFKGNPQEFYWNKNIHFNFKGLKLYGELVAQRLLSLTSKTDHSNLAGALPDE